MASLRSSSSTSILSLATAFTSFIFVVDAGDAMAFVLPGLRVIEGVRVHSAGVGSPDAALPDPYWPDERVAELMEMQPITTEPYWMNARPGGRRRSRRPSYWGH